MGKTWPTLRGRNTEINIYLFKCDIVLYEAVLVRTKDVKVFRTGRSQ